MNSNSAVNANARKQRRLLSPSQKYELFVAVLTGQCTQREAAEKVEGGPLHGDHDLPNRQAGRAGGAVSATRATGQDRRADRAGGGAGRGRAAARHGRQAGGGAAHARGKTCLGLTAGPVPTRVDGNVKAGLLELVDHAVEHGWSARRACQRLGLDHGRYQQWIVRRGEDRLDDLPPGGNPLHGILEWERAAIVALFEAWGEVDRSHRKLAHRGSRIDRVHVSESTVRRVLAAEGLVLQGNPPREPVPRTRGQTGWSGNPTGCGDTTSRTSPGPAEPRSRCWTSSPASGSAPCSLPS